MRRAMVNGVELEYEVTGSGEPVLMIAPVLADGFVPLLSERVLTDRYQLITYHKRGWSGSTKTPAPVTIEDHAVDAAALLGYLGLERAHVAGHSSGAAIALQLAFDRPEIVHSLALMELSTFTVPSASEFFERAGPAFDRYAKGDHETALSIFMSLVSGMDWHSCRALLEKHIPGAESQAMRDVDTFFGIELPSLTQWSFSAEQAAAIQQPVLSMLGRNTERLWVDVAELLRTWFPQVEDCVIEDVGHLLHIQRSEPVARGIAEFLGRHRLTGATTSSANVSRSVTVAIAS